MNSSEKPASPDWLQKAVSDLEGSRGRKALPELDRAALVVIDLQRLFVDESSPAFVGSFRRVEPSVRKVVQGARRVRMPIFWTRHVHPPEDGGGTIGHFFGRLLLEDDPLAAYADGFGPGPDEVEFTKARHSVFCGTDLKTRLSAMGIRAVVMVGVRAELCVLASAVEAGSLGFLPVVVADGVASSSEREHRATLSVLASGLAHIATSDEVCARMVAQVAENEPEAADEECELLVVGSGPAGIAAAMQAIRDGLSVRLVGDEKPGGMVWAAGPMANVPGFDRGVSGDRMGRRLCQVVEAENFLIRGRIEKLRRERDGGFLARGPGCGLRCNAVVLATGTGPSPFEVEGFKELVEAGRAHRDLRSLPEKLDNESVLIVGGGDAAFDTALSVTRRGGRAAVVVRGDRAKAAAHLVRHAEAAEVVLCYETTVRQIESDRKRGKSTAFVRTGKGERRIELDHLVVCVGRRPNDELLTQLGGRLDPAALQGYGPSGVFLAGDLIAGRDRFLHRALGDGQKAASRAREYLRRRSGSGSS